MLFRSERFEEALLFRRIATLVTDVPVGSVDEWCWHGPTDTAAAMAERLGAPQLVARATKLGARSSG